MKIEDLKQDWDRLHQMGLSAHDSELINTIVERGTSSVVAEMNKKLFRGIAILALAAVISALAVVFFYYQYDSAKYAWIDVSKLVPIQVLSFVIFSVLLLDAFFQYKLINRPFTAEAVKTHLTITLSKIQQYNTLFSIVVAALLLAVYYFLISYFVGPDDFTAYTLVAIASVVLTLVSHFVNRRYWQHAMKAHMNDLRGYLTELDTITQQP